MKSTGINIKLGMLSVVLLILTVSIVVVFGQLRFDRTNSYSAVFSNASGLRSGQFVRASGVEVGKVKKIQLVEGGQRVRVDFTVDRSLPLYQSTTASIRYQDLIGNRYVELKRGGGDGADQVWNPSVHQWHPQLHRSRNLALPTNRVGAVDAVDGEAQLADGRSPLAFMAADRSSAMPHRRGIQEIHCVLVAAIKERTALKRQASGYGTKFGRPRKVKDRSHITTARRMKADGHTGKDIAKFSG